MSVINSNQIQNNFKKASTHKDGNYTFKPGDTIKTLAARLKDKFCFAFKTSQLEAVINHLNISGENSFEPKSGDRITLPKSNEEIRNALLLIQKKELKTSFTESVKHSQHETYIPNSLLGQIEKQGLIINYIDLNNPTISKENPFKHAWKLPVENMSQGFCNIEGASPVDKDAEGQLIEYDTLNAGKPAYSTSKTTKSMTKFDKVNYFDHGEQSGSYNKIVGTPPIYMPMVTSTPHISRSDFIFRASSFYNNSLWKMSSFYSDSLRESGRVYGDAIQSVPSEAYGTTGLMLGLGSIALPPLAIAATGVTGLGLIKNLGDVAEGEITSGQGVVSSTLSVLGQIKYVGHFFSAMSPLFDYSISHFSQKQFHSTIDWNYDFGSGWGQELYDSSSWGQRTNYGMDNAKW